MKESIPPSKFRRYFKMAADQTQALHRSDGAFVRYIFNCIVCDFFNEVVSSLCTFSGFDTSVIEVSRENVNEFIEDLMFIMT